MSNGHQEPPARLEEDEPPHDGVTIRWLQGYRLEVAGTDSKLHVDVSAPEGGDGGAFRSVELLLGALGTCMAGTMLGFARTGDIPIGQLDLRLRPVLASSPNRVERIEVQMRIGGPVSQRQLASLQRVAQHCKIHSTLERSARVELTIDAPAAVA